MLKLTVTVMRTGMGTPSFVAGLKRHHTLLSQLERCGRVLRIDVPGLLAPV